MAKTRFLQGCYPKKIIKTKKERYTAEIKKNVNLKIIKYSNNTILNLNYHIRHISI